MGSLEQFTEMMETHAECFNRLAAAEELLIFVLRYRKDIFEELAKNNDTQSGYRIRCLESIILAGEMELGNGAANDHYSGDTLNISSMGGRIAHQSSIINQSNYVNATPQRSGTVRENTAAGGNVSWHPGVYPSHHHAAQSSINYHPSLDRKTLGF